MDNNGTITPSVSATSDIQPHPENSCMCVVRVSPAKPWIASSRLVSWPYSELGILRPQRTVVVRVMCSCTTHVFTPR
ncbi:hypothetical protein COCMIDRAFT_93007 [Bipolaris oryzae ATCC 44560]|uniref:Uncharacterized protein n=1 Tax=Bipolaris oryzae ATCC 44560 TaxID=930090 RepID=W6ZFV5_COCMI|nr:uncharacterized protein COCMIDRAFT_93007 [Bipolaris oryzae ATCC 44560]EUC46399.1 hypothetical protein COCMIDRAFT_93007 [Bipolaris oryzae ATCC 44560]